MRYIGVVVMLLLLSCAPADSPIVEPPITPVPTPTPEPIFAGLVSDGPNFTYYGEPIYLAGASNADDRAEWSIYPPSEIDRIYAHGGNFTHIRLGPFWASDMPLATGMSLRLYDSAYTIVDDKADLANWNPIFWNRVTRLLQHAATYDRLFVVEVDLICRWMLQHGNDGISPWTPDNNIQGFDGGHLGVTRHAPLPEHRRFVRKAVEVCGRYNVIFQTGNEGMKGYSREFEQGIIDEVRSALRDFGYPARPIGTNTHDPEIERLGDYACRHLAYAQPAESYPVMVNEYDEADLWGAENYRRELRSARRHGTMFHIWRCAQEEWEYEELLDALMEEITNE